MKLVLDTEAELSPGEWHGYGVGDCSSGNVYLVDIDPLQPSVNGALIEKYVVQPEYDVKKWSDVLRVQIGKSQPALRVRIRVYAMHA